MTHKKQHLALRPQCGICTELIFKHERVIAIYHANDDSSSSIGFTRSFAFPKINPGDAYVDGFRLCRYANCRDCAASPGPEPVTIHFDCYSIFAKECHGDMDAMRRLWVRSAWRLPWRGAQPLDLSGRKLDSDALKRTAEISGLSGICRLPCELFDMIHLYARRSLFWRCISAIRLASFVTGTAPGPYFDVQLSNVLSWKRNGDIEYIEPKTRPPIIRLTIDSDGISRVERLSSAPVYSGECNNSHRTIVQHETEITRIQVQVRDGLMRLKLPKEQSALPIWNTPAPPDLAAAKFYYKGHSSRLPIRRNRGAVPFSWQTFHAVEVEKIRGITFYFYFPNFCGIHIHYEDEPSVTDDNYERFTNIRHKESVWVYLPIPKNDRLLALDIRKARERNGLFPGLNILARTRLVGDIIIGQQTVTPFKDLCLSNYSPQTIVYGKGLDGSPVEFFGTYCKSPEQAEPPKPFSRLKYGSHLLSLDVPPFYSWASLDDVTSTLTFNDRGTRLCKGIMFQYRNGGCRTVGQCRWHVDSAIRVDHPRVFQFKRDNRPVCRRGVNQLVHLVQVAFQHSEEEQADKGWECHPLKGYVEFFFRDISSYLVFAADKACPYVDMSVHK